MAKRVKLTGPSIVTRDQMERVVGQICALTILRDQTTATMDGRLQEIRQQYEQQLSDTAGELDKLMAMAQDWAEEHPEEFGKRRSIEMVHGTLGFRTGTPKLKTLKGWTWDRVLEMLKSANLSYLIRRKEEVNKEAILAEAAKQNLQSWCEIGCQVVQDESFFVEPNRAPLAPTSVSAPGA